MARVALTKSVAPGGYPSAGVTVTFTAADTGDGNSFVFTGAELIIARNKHVSDAKTFTISSAANEHGRSKNITAQSLVAGAYAIVGPMRRKLGWAQADDLFYLAGEDANIEFAVITLPAN